MSRPLEQPILLPRENPCSQRPGPVFLALTAMLLTLGFAGVDDGIVLCFGGDGHVAIEAAGPEGCAEVDEIPDHPASAIAIPVSSSHCGPCVDVVLATSSATEAVKATKRTPSAPAAVSAPELRPRVPYLRASVEGASLRLRAVLMTAATTALGLMPLLLSTGVGSEVQRPLATVVVGGLITSTAVTLLFLPAFYEWFAAAPRSEEAHG